MKKNILSIIIIVILFLGNIFFALQLIDARMELKKLEAQSAERQVNENVVSFLQLFVEKVLRSSGEIDFDTRFELESAVRSINDEAISKQWQVFVDSQTEFEAQRAVEDLLDILVRKLSS